MENYIEMPSIESVSELGMNNLKEVIPSFDFADFVTDITQGKNIFKADNILKSLLNIFAREMSVSLKLLTVILGIVVIASLLENIRSSFNKKGIVSTQIITAALIAGLAGEIFLQTGEYSAGVCDDITKIMWAVLPIIGTLIAGSGFITTLSITNPTLYFICNVFAELFNRILVPLSILYFAISLSEIMTDAIKLEKFREFIKKSYNFILGFIMTLFTGILGVSSFAGTSMDSAGAKGVKFAVSNLVPFVGRSISEAMNSVVAASLLIKNAVGIIGIICILGLSIIPVVKTAATVVAVRLGTAICEPIADEKTVKILTAVADSLSMINAAVIATAMMMIISLSIIVGIK